MSGWGKFYIGRKQNGRIALCAIINIFCKSQQIHNDIRKHFKRQLILNSRHVRLSNYFDLSVNDESGVDKTRVLRINSIFL